MKTWARDSLWETSEADKKKTRQNLNLENEWFTYYLVYYDYFSTGMK